MNSLVSIIIVNWNGLSHLPACLETVRKQSYVPIETILVDNGSQDGSVEWVKENFPEVKLIALPDNRGFCEGNNIGIQAARGEFIALLNNDTQADPKWILESINALESQLNAGFTASRIRMFDSSNILDAAGDKYFSSGFPAKRGWLEKDGPQFNEAKWVFGASGAAVVYRKSMLDRIGCFDNAYFAYIEDVDLSFRAQLTGHKCLYVPDAIVYHKGSATSGHRSESFLYWSNRNRWYTLIKDLPGPLWLRYFPAILTTEILVLASAIRKGRTGFFLKARCDVIKNLLPMLKKRRDIQAARTVSIKYLDGIIDRNWFSNRTQEISREKEFFKNQP